MIKINTQFDVGSVTIKDSSDPDNIWLALRPDNASYFAQWFYFRFQGAAYQNYVTHFENAADAAYPQGWEDYQACAFYDRRNWFRMPTTYENGVLVINHTPLFNSVYCAYFEPYSYEQHPSLLDDAQGSDLCRIDDSGSTVQGRDISLLTIGNRAESDLKIWIIARQHPGETMAEWFVEGLLGRLLDLQNPTARTLLDRATFYVVPNMNPSGSVLGDLRTDAAGVNLNREWENPTLERSPEVFLVRERMLEAGVDLFLDIHGDENLPFVFVADTESVPNYNPRIAALETQFRTALLSASSDFQDEYDYEKDAPSQADMTLTTNWVGNRFSCLAFTLEVPFKDNLNLPDNDFGWNSQRSLRLGEAMLSAVLQISADLS